MGLDILVHTCCGTCSIMPFLKLIEEGFNPIGYFYNPNIHPLKEYLARRIGVNTCMKKIGSECIYEDKGWDIKKWFLQFFEYNNKELRCNKCISIRLEATFKMAANKKIKYVSTTLLYSIYQPHAFIMDICNMLAKRYNINFIYRDFRQYWILGQKIANKWQIYRQSYCGCIFSEVERYKPLLFKLY